MRHSYFRWRNAFASLSSIRLITLGILLVAGCGQDSATVGPEKGAGNATDRQNAELPKGFPRDVPLYPEAKVGPVKSNEVAIVVQLRTADTVLKADTIYKEKLQQSGWEIQNPIRTPQQAKFHATKAGRKVSVILMASSGETHITLAVEKEG